MTAPAANVRSRPWQALPWTGWLVDVVLLPSRLLLVLARLAARVEWTPDAVMAAVVLGLPTTALVGLGLTHTTWTGVDGLYRGVGGVVVLAVLLGLLAAGGVTRTSGGAGRAQAGGTRLGQPRTARPGDLHARTHPARP